MTDKPTPTDAELKAMWQLHAADIGGIFYYARAVLAKWGQPVVAGDVDRADAVNLARNALTQYDCAITKKGVRVLAEAVLSMDSALTTPQPTHAQAGELERFAALVAAKEREACAQIADIHALGWQKSPGANPEAGFIASSNCATAIRARGKP